MRNPERGEVWWVDLGIAGKVRPAVLSDEQMQRLDTVVRNWLGGGE